MIRTVRSLFASRPAVRSVCRPLSVAPADVLESRILPTVTLTQTGGLLTMTGDATVNDLEIEAVSGGIKISGNSGTQISFNGALSSSVTLAGVTDLKGTFGALDDRLELTNGVALNTITLQMGDGANKLEIEDCTVSGALSFASGIGSDTVEFETTSLAAITLNTGSGSDDVEFHGCTVSGIVSITTGNGDDTVESDLANGITANTFQAAVTVNTGNQNDKVEFKNATFTALSIDTGSGNDDVKLEDVDVQAGITVNSGSGNNKVELRRVDQTGIEANLFTSTSGIDEYKFKGVLFTGATTINLGSGIGNRLELDDAKFLAGSTFTSQGINDLILIEQDNSQSSGTEFHGKATFTLGANAQLSLSQAGAGFNTRFFDSCSFKGSKLKAKVIATAVTAQTTFDVQPTIKNVVLSNV